MDEPVALRRERRRPAETVATARAIDVDVPPLAADDVVVEAGEEAQVEHIPVGEVVTERLAPWQDGDALIVPIYEEQLVVVKRLVLREKVRISGAAAREHRLIVRDQSALETPASTRDATARLPIDADPPPRPPNVEWAERLG